MGFNIFFKKKKRYLQLVAVSLYGNQFWLEEERMKGGCTKTRRKVRFNHKSSRILQGCLFVSSGWMVSRSKLSLWFICSAGQLLLLLLWPFPWPYNPHLVIGFVCPQESFPNNMQFANFGPAWHVSVVFVGGGGGGGYGNITVEEEQVAVTNYGKLNLIICSVCSERESKKFLQLFFFYFIALDKSLMGVDGNAH